VILYSGEMVAFVLSSGVGLGKGGSVSRCGLDRTSLWFGASVVGRRARADECRGASNGKRQVSMVGCYIALLPVGFVF